MDEKVRTFLTRRTALALVLVLAALISFAAVGPWAASPAMQAPILEDLDQKKADVLELTAAATGTAVAITLLPGDAATPIAEKLTDISQYLLIVLCAIYLEKYLVTVMGFIAFRVLIPIALLLIAAGVIMRSRGMRRIGLRAVLLGVVLFLVMPASYFVTGLIEKTYSASVDGTIEAANQTIEGIEAEEAQQEAQEQAAAAQQQEEEKPSLWDTITGLPSSMAETAADAIKDAAGVSRQKIEELQTLLNNFMESVAVMIINSCVIPILVLLFFFGIVKMLMGAQYAPPAIYIDRDPMDSFLGRKRGEKE